MFNFQRIRGALFYLSLLIFIGGLPFILASALGYKFNRHTIKFVKTGLIYIKTQPEGAQVYLDGRLISQKSPASLQDLTPGSHKITLELAHHYPWKGEVDVEAGKVSRLDKIILFPLRPNLEQLNREKFSSFRIDTDRRIIYYLDQANRIVYRSDLDANNFEDIATLPQNFSLILGWEVSADRKKLFIFNQHQISVVFFDNQGDYGYADFPVFLDYPAERVTNVFWHSDNYHLVVLTDKGVQVIEARASAKPVKLVELNSQSQNAVYNVKEDALYFGDGENLYRLGLSSNLFLLERLMSQPLGAAKPQQREGSDE